ncbi:MAG TPA: DEAD/DEAH box helicase [Acidimicrobiales bacterium]
MHPTFATLGVATDLVAVLAGRGVIEPFPIQAATLPDALAGRDVTACAPTGSGKTLAFGLPIVSHVRKARPGRPRALVLAPTRELAAQITAELAPLAAARGRKIHAFYGGTSFVPQRKALRRGVDVAVACPGRLTDLVTQGDVTLADVELVVVDEADRMADIGFLPQVRRLVDATDPERQVLLFSATLDGDVGVLVRDYQRDPAHHEIAPPATGPVDHRLWFVGETERTERATELVMASPSAMVFTRTRHGADRLAKRLAQVGVTVAPLHGGRTQAQRDRALDAFRQGRVRALVATDVAARGIHVDGVACVVQYDLPADAKDYVHRAGRTGRAGAAGMVVTLATPSQRPAAEKLFAAVGATVTVSSPGGGPARAPLSQSRVDARRRAAPRRNRQPMHVGDRRHSAAPHTHRAGRSPSSSEPRATTPRQAGRR